MANVCVLYTGGTIGCAGRPAAPLPGPDFAALVARLPGLEGGRVAGYDELTYVLEWLPQPRDSADLGPADWAALALRLLDRYGEYDGFVVLHGTDTMAAAASALSFMLPGLCKPVILTGAQIPLAETYSDASANLTGAIILAGTQSVPESCIFFASKLLRGNCAVKADCSRLAAFASPRSQPLGEAGTGLVVDVRRVRPRPPPPLALAEPANRDALRARLKALVRRLESFSAIVLALYPGIRASTVRAALSDTRPAVKGVVLEAFGAGNGPSDPAFLAALKAASDAGAVLAVTSRSWAGGVDLAAYASGAGLAGVGCIGAGTMTTDATLAKLVWLIGNGLPAAEVRDAMQVDLAGELDCD